MGMLHAAEFGALPAVDAGSFRPNGEFVGTAGDEILLCRRGSAPRTSE